MVTVITGGWLTYPFSDISGCLDLYRAGGRGGSIIGVPAPKCGGKGGWLGGWFSLTTYLT